VAPTYCLVWSNVPGGLYTLTAKATDIFGASSVSDAVHISVGPPPDPHQPVVTIAATDAHASEPVRDPGVFTVYRLGNTSATLHVQYRIEGTASNGLDYATISNSVVIPAGETSARIIINPLHDTSLEGTETVTLRLLEPFCIAIYPPPPECYRVGTPGAATVYIADEDAPTTNQPPTVQIFTPTDGESFVAPANIFIAAQAQDLDGYLTIQFVEFFAGSMSLSIRTNYPTLDPTGPFKLYWTNVPAGEYVLTAKATDNQGGATVSNPVHVSVQEPSPWPCVSVRATDPDAREPGDNGMFTIYRTGPTNFPLSVYYSFLGTASNGMDYLTLPKVPVWPPQDSVSIPAGARSVDVLIEPVNDNLAEGPETVVLRLAYCSDFAPCYDINAPGSAVIILRDDEPAPTNTPPILTIYATDPLASEPGVLTIIDPGVFTIYRSGNTNTTLLAQYAVSGSASNGVDYSALTNAVVIPAGQVSANVVINPLLDNWSESTETVMLRLLDPPCRITVPRPPECYEVGLPDSENRDIVFIADNHLPPPATNHLPTVHIFTPANGASFVAPASLFMAAHAQDLDGYLTIQFVEFFAGSNSLGIRTNYPTLDPIGPFKLHWTNVPPGEYVLTAKAVDEKGAIGVSPPVNIRIIGTNPPPTNLTIVTIAAPDPIASEGTNCYRWPGWPTPLPSGHSATNTATFLVRRTGPTNTALAVHQRIGGTASNGVDYVALPDVVTIPAGQRAAEFRIVPLDDALHELIETVVLSLSLPPDPTDSTPPYHIGSPGRAAAIIVDNDHPRPVTGALPDRSFHIMQPGANGTWWRIECSTDLVHWTPLSTNVVTDGAVHFVDPDAAEMPQRFYRALPETNPPAE
jgi:hypothetical protein